MGAPPGEPATVAELQARCAALETRFRLQLEILHAIGVSSPDFTYVFDRDHRFVYVSPPLLALWGKTLEEAVGKTFADLGYPTELVALHRQQLDEALTGRTVSGGNAYVSPEGVEGHYEYTFVPVRGDDGQVQSIVGTTRDVTSRVRAERERTVALDRITESEEQFRSFADAMPQLAWIAQADGFIYWYNRRWYEYSGTTPAQMEGWGWRSVHDPQELPRVMEQWTSAIRRGELFETSFPLRASDGTYRWFLTRASPLRNARGEIVRWFGTNTDIDAQRRALAERDAALAEAKAAVRFRDEFLSIASHELKTPLAALLLHLQGADRLAARQEPLELIRERLQKSIGAGQRLDRLITALLDVSRIAAGRLLLEPEPTDLCALVREVCARHDHRTPTLHVSAEGSIVGSWDPLRLDQVVTNLIDNAIKYGAGKPVAALVGREGDLAVLRVIDQGIGIPQDQQRRIFERFERTEAAREYTGFGLGLWIARQVVEASGGSISVESREGDGATFVVTLPLGEANG